MRFASCALALVVVIVAVLSPRIARADGTEAPLQAKDDRLRFAGTFRFGGSTAEEAARAAAIDRTLSGLFFAFRGIARSRLSAGTRIDPWVSFAFPDGRIGVRVPSAPEAASPDTGSAVGYVSSGGDRVRLSQRIAGGKLTQVFAAEEGTRVNEWTLSADGITLVLRVTVSSSRLSRPLVYALTYQRSS